MTPRRCPCRRERRRAPRRRPGPPARRAGPARHRGRAPCSACRPGPPPCRRPRRGPAGRPSSARARRARWSVDSQPRSCATIEHACAYRGMIGVAREVEIAPRGRRRRARWHRAPALPPAPAARARRAPPCISRCGRETSWLPPSGAAGAGGRSASLCASDNRSSANRHMSLPHGGVRIARRSCPGRRSSPYGAKCASRRLLGRPLPTSPAPVRLEVAVQRGGRRRTQRRRRREAVDHRNVLEHHGASGRGCSRRAPRSAIARGARPPRRAPFAHQAARDLGDALLLRLRIQRVAAEEVDLLQPGEQARAGIASRRRARVRRRAGTRAPPARSEKNSLPAP